MRLRLTRSLLSSEKALRRYCSLVKSRLFIRKSSEVIINEKNQFGMLGCRRISMATTLLNPSNDQDLLEAELDQLVSDENHESIARLIYSIPGIGHRIFLIQPYLKYGPDRISKDKASIKLVEAHALVETLHNWKVVDKMVIATGNNKQKQVFGSGNIDLLKSIINPNNAVSAVFINIDRLNGLQYSELISLFGLPVYDRFSIVLQIFKDNSRSRVSKLQIAVAEIPYLKSRLTWYQKGGYKTDYISNLHLLSGAVPMDMNVRRELLEKRELKLKEVVTKLKVHRKVIRQKRQKLRLPTIAVVGYTNAGKTSLIKSLTGDSKMRPVNHLFATLDVTVHGGYLPSRMQVLYVDTVGFISDIPTVLIESFHATLEDATLADMIIHVRDLSHPETEAQKICVLETLKILNLPQSLQENIIEVGNKIDLVPNSEYLEEKSKELMLISATNGTGLASLQQEVESRMMEVKGYGVFTFRVPNGGEEFRWLYKEAAVTEVLPDNEDDDYLLMEVVINKSMILKFKTNFPDIKLYKRKISKTPLVDKI